mmetsp:Transcript_15307/g.22434  ORF Transcript_15307/g.22434 Transcript_15307/m.22434 type:complete len:419 (-) Transcript_15307:157-1413(-)|eukprot:CAMPEP_0197238974 /NCGR_PEP_ID=MMETSP1429-20130617/5473_1 /TAXON_ID=49237 /ORGANISM="Chaetoceros  sp., Strain UNC1202" /LENGTH=418 /DNA_ID=CAMNT_0042698273 /DNA_START=101 /DNA_END=1357 /DNA_ORIENTATION=+
MKFGSALIMLGLSAVVSSSSASTIGGPASKSKTSVVHRKPQLGLNSLSLSPSSSKEEDSEQILPLSIDASHDSARIVPRGGNAKDRMKIGFYFGLWYALNVIYNILNKKLLNIIPAPVTVGTIQLGIGAAYAALLWITGIRSKPRLTPKGKEICLKVGVYHGSGQLFSMVSLGAGPVSFTHIVKALEPFFSAIISGIFFGKWMKPQVYLSLIPVVGGVGYACLKERSFSWLAFWMAMSSNLAFALRAVVSKTGMVNYIGENMNSVNLFAVVTTVSFFLCIPAAILSEKTKLLGLWAAATTGENAVITSAELTKSLIISGLFHYLNNEVMYLALSNVHPVTLAVGNTMKRVFIMVASVLVFHNPVSMQAGIGSGIGISGVLLYSLTKQYYEKLEASAAAAAAEALAAAQPKGRRGRGRK